MVVALNLNPIIANRSAGSAGVFQGCKQFWQVRLVRIEPQDQCHNLPPLSLFEPQSSRLPLVGKELMSWRRALAVGLQLLTSITSWRDIELGSLKESHFMAAQTLISSQLRWRHHTLRQSIARTPTGQQTRAKKSLAVAAPNRSAVVEGTHDAEVFRIRG